MFSVATLKRTARRLPLALGSAGLLAALIPFAGLTHVPEVSASPLAQSSCTAPDPANSRTFNYQGLLRLANGSLANGTYKITLKIYGTVTGTVANEPLHSEEFPTVTVRDGVFTVVLGDCKPLSAKVFEAAPRFLGITVGPSTAELVPRQRIHPVPWAMQATTLVPGALVKREGISEVVLASADDALIAKSSRNDRAAIGAGNDAGGWGVYATSNGKPAVEAVNPGGTAIFGNGGGYGVHGRSFDNFGVLGESTNSTGLYGKSTNGFGVNGLSINNAGVHGQSDNANGIIGETKDRGDSGVWGVNHSGGPGVTGEGRNGGVGLWGIGAVAGKFDGKVEVNGPLRTNGDLDIGGGWTWINGFSGTNPGDGYHWIGERVAPDEDLFMTFIIDDGKPSWIEMRPRLRVWNDVYANNFIRNSDARLKTNVAPVADALEQLENVNGVTYTLKSTGSREMGVIAQELEEVFPELVTTGSDGYKAVNYDGLSGVFIEAIKELRSENEELKAGNAELLRRIEALEQQAK